MPKSPQLTSPQSAVAQSEPLQPLAHVHTAEPLPVLQVPWSGWAIDVDMDDWMWRIDDETVLNRTVMSKFGFRAGEVTLSFRRR